MQSSAIVFVEIVENSNKKKTKYSNSYRIVGCIIKEITKKMAEFGFLIYRLFFGAGIRIGAKMAIKREKM